MAKSKLKVGTISFKQQAAQGDTANNFMLTCILITLPHLHYGMDYPAVLLNDITSTYLSNIYFR